MSLPSSTERNQLLQRLDRLVKKAIEDYGLIDEGDHVYYTYRLDGAEFPENGIVPAESFWFEGETPESGTT